MTQTGFNTTTLYGTAAQTGMYGSYGTTGTGGSYNNLSTPPTIAPPDPSDMPTAPGQPNYQAPGGENQSGNGLPIRNNSNFPSRMVNENRLGETVKVRKFLEPYLIRNSENATKNGTYSYEYLKTKIGTAGNEIGTHLKNLLNEIDKEWTNLSEEKKQNLQDILGSPVNGWIAWDCLELNHENPMIAFPNSIPGTILDKTVTVNGRVYHAGEVNYIVYGRIIRLITERNVSKWSSIENRDQRVYLQKRERLNGLSNMLTLIAGYRMARKFGGLLGETNIQARQHWALAGWNHGEFPWENWVAQDSLKFNTGQRILKGEPYRSHIIAEFGKKLFSTEIVFTAFGKLK